ncbi:MAG: hypothetical protein WC799_12630 [Desulfobacteraceae bacterium]
MKKIIYLAMICLFLTLWGCSDSSNGVDPIENFRDFSVDLRNLVKDEFVKAGLELDALPDDDPNEEAYIKVTEDIMLQYLYCNYIIEKVINLDIASNSGNVFRSENSEITVTVSDDGLYRMDGEFHVTVDESWELLNVTFTWNPATNRWLITGSRLDLPSEEDDEPVPFLRQEGEWHDDSQVYSATTLYFVEDETRRVSNAYFTYGISISPFRMVSEREECVENCVDIDSTDLYDQGIVAMELTEWNDFKRYSVEDGIPEYEMPAPIVEVR